MSTLSISKSGSFSSQRSSAKAAAMANLAAKRKMRNAARFGNRVEPHQQQQSPTASRKSNEETRQAEDPVGIDSSNLEEELRVKTEKEMASVGNEALILVYGYNPNLYEDVFALSPESSIRDIKRSYQEQTSQLEHTLATVFTSDVPDDEINAALNESQMEAAVLCGMTSAHMEQMHPRNFLEVKMDALKRAFDILKDEQSRIEYDAVLLEFQELSTERKLSAVAEADEDENEYDVNRDIDYGEHGDYSYDNDDDEEEDEGANYEEDSTAFDNNSAAVTDPRDENEVSDDESEVFSYPTSPTLTLAKHPWKQEQQLQQSPRDPFDFDQQYYQPSVQDQSDYSIVTSRSTRSVHVDLFDPFDLQGADQINFNHLPMVEPNSEEEESYYSTYTEETEMKKRKDDDTVTVFQYPIPEADNEDDDDDNITVGKVIEARARGEEVVLPRRYPNMVDFVPRKKKGIKPKLRSIFQSMKRGASKSSKRSVASDSPKFQSNGVRVMSLTPTKKTGDFAATETPQSQAKSKTTVMSIDPQGPNLSAEESDEESEASQEYDDEDGDYSVQTDVVSELTKDTFLLQQQRPPQPRQLAASNTDIEVETFLNMANDFRAMDGVNDGQSTEDDGSGVAHSNSNGNLSITPQLKRRAVSSNDSTRSTGKKSDDYLKHYPMKSLLSVDTDDEDYEMNRGDSILEEWVGVIDEIEEMWDDSLEGISSICSCDE